MKTLIAFLILLISCASSSPEPPPSHPVEVTAAMVQVEPVVVVVPVSAALPVPLSPKFEHLRDYVRGIMESWPKGSKELPTTDLFDVASDIAAAVGIEPTTVEIVTSKACSTVRGSDRCFWGEGFNSDGAKAALLAAIAYYEGSRFADYADRSLCTSEFWRKTPTGVHFMHLGGDCDSGHAFSIWQIPPIEAKSAKGSHIDGVCDREHVGPGTYNGVDGINRFGAARCALELARESIATRSNLAQYTGEIGSYHPKADERLEFARAAIRKHPWVELP